MLLRPALIRPPVARDAASLCSRCLFKASVASQRSFATSEGRRSSIGSSPNTPRLFQKKEFFISYDPSKRVVKKSVLSSLPTTRDHTASLSTGSSAVNTPIPGAPEQTQELPHRRRKRLKEEAKSRDDGPEEQLPLDASAQLSALSSSLPTSSLRRKCAAYLALAKPRLSVLILLSTTSAYGLYPITTLLALDPSVAQLPTLSTSTLTFLYLTAGTFLSSASANAFNMFFEPEYDALMSRTRNRPLVRGLISRRGALIFAIATCIIGIGLLYIGTNPTVAGLSAANVFLYGFVYTPMKRIHVINTWVGAIVGAIPPMMGWVAAAGQTATTGHDTWKDMLLSEESLGGWILASMLFAWQFPHFNSLSHLIRYEYKAAGHKMMCWVNPARNARVALRYSILMFPIAFAFWWGGSLANGWMLKEAYRFWKYQGAKGSARGLFWASVWQLPIFLIGGLATKKGVWDGVYRRIFGEPDDDFDDDEESYEDETEEDNVPTGKTGNIVPLKVAESRA
ncbi:heme a biosynthesis protein, putative [Talaromyces stipitatus ATCC 10500]|uniref:Protoheme IX farnesyltransferase, mitochondrial n=1 Tax=Talaromyces stipitatus (strain ATCC 10500 / CBS 375.48 / QM 6759 / NRRL 1006) TaxID=441959 RepID=B8MGE3_TALSN|nr:heme a biosynthesis protein, putative [Talaromyces stipitatus ATCC 10500]EED16263.1 heme a biosynthesis protein, putative [Talaromyces stipitatus ATCC 10500]